MDTDSKKDFLEAVHLINEQRFGKAIRVLKSIELHYGDLPELHYNLAISYKGLKETGKALASLENAMKLRPENSKYLGLATVLTEQIDDIDKSIWYYERLLQLEPEHPKHLQHLGYLYLKNDEPESAVTTFEKAISIEDNNPEIKFTLGLLYYQSQREEMAIDLFKQLLNSTIDKEEVVKFLSASYQNLERYEQAMRLLEEWYLEDPRIETLRELARLAYRMDRYDNALNYIEKYFEFQPDDLDLLLLKAHILREQKQNHTAMSIYDDILRIDKENISAIKGKAMLHLEMDEIEEANQLFEFGQKLS